MTTETTISLTLSLHAFGCLRGLIEREIDQVERWRRVLGVSALLAEKDMTEVYLGQLRAALAPVEAVYDELGAS